jgi:hypothetical protein
MNYKIIQNEFLLNDFIQWLPDLKPNEMFYVALFARSKYGKVEGLKSDKCQLKRFTSNKEMLFSKIKQLECELGTYKMYGVTIPQEILALYIMPNPRDLELAGQQTALELTKLGFKPYSNYNPHQIALNNIQDCSSRKLYYDFDFDHVTPDDVIPKLEGKINLNATTIVRTRGGFHLLVKTDRIEPQYSKSWHQGIAKVAGCDVRGDNLMPVVGCTQGSYTPHFGAVTPKFTI